MIEITSGDSFVIVSWVLETMKAEQGEKSIWERESCRAKTQDRFIPVESSVR